MPEPLSFTTATHLVRGLPLAYHTWQRAPSAPLLLLLHGFLDHGRSFAPVAERLASHFRVVAPDHRGHGDSAWAPPGAAYHFPDYLSDLSALVDHLAPATPIALAGHSMGASIAVTFAGAFPERVARLALLDSLGPSPTPPEQTPAQLRRWIHDLTLYTNRSEDFGLMSSLTTVTKRLARTSPYASPERLLALAETAAHAVPGGFRFRFDPLHRTMAPVPFDVTRFRAFLRAITARTLVVWGEHTPLRPPDAEARLADLRSVVRAELAGAAHNLHHEQPAALAELLLTFFTASDASAPRLTSSTASDASP